MNSFTPEESERLDKEIDRHLEQEEDILDIKRELENSGVVDFGVDGELNIEMAEEDV